MEQVGVFGIAGGFMAALGVVLAGVLAFANRRLSVQEDPRIDQVEDLLPKSNCGACGLAGCRNFAEQVVSGEVVPARCTVSAPEQVGAIARLLGVGAGEVEKRVARLACAGGKHVARMRAHYAGLETCRAAAVVSGGGKECAWGCLGLGDCVTVCKHGAITLDLHGLPVVDVDKCTACNDCVEVCPKGLFSVEPADRRLWIACRNRAEGDVAEASCEVACTACGRCVADAPEGLMALKNNLVEIDYGWNDQAERRFTDRCPTGAIVWFDDRGRALRGHAAKKILRHDALPVRQ
ncbi:MULTISPECIES: (Fe-S)-binding protein [unclassified Rubrivivax]|uniref:(Fe-S)-binding protein n=1 Tax=unclassified Rubrivivax TaxID=2649762 RepID=UPI0013E95BFD|nr:MULTISPECIES: (Fe-S)-binding protein [unclassified Rubrivivax]MCC9597161.1 4Fe-4S binding protein [Rubrivivax sp. JA1055]MCC9646580.1 4Fe-4S binding protein [Rubrivivax sp. JA1029]MCD0416866.1 4Fe-4S binding protein [Rubrivivax sp. JA1024]